MSDKSELKKAYMNAAKKQIKESNKMYDKNISQANANALARGMGRSSYALQTEANLTKEKSSAANQIKSDANDAFIQAWLEYKQKQDQIKIQQDQLALQQAQWEWNKQQAAASAASSGSSSPYNPGTKDTNDSNSDGIPDWLQAANNFDSSGGIAGAFGNAVASALSNVKYKKKQIGGGGTRYDMIK